MPYLPQLIQETEAKALRAEKKEQWPAAHKNWLDCATLMKKLAHQASSGESRKRRKEKALSYQERSREIVQLHPEVSAKLPTEAKNPATSAIKKVAAKRVSHPTHQKKGKTATLPQSEYHLRVQNLLFHSSVTWDQIGGHELVRRETEMAIGIILAEKPAGVRLVPPANFLLIGPPGTGKTICVAAISNQLQADAFYNVKASDLLSKYHGESARMVSALFSAARSDADTGRISLIFIDEIDSLGGTPNNNGTSADKHIISTLLAEMDGLKEKGEDQRIIVIASTNRPDQLDHAVRSRFQRQIYVGLPDLQERKEIFTKLLQSRGVTTEADIDELAALTRDFSGRDIDGVIRNAISRMIGRTNPELREMVRHNPESLGSYTLKLCPLLADDLISAIDEITIDHEEVKQCREFFDKYCNK